MKINPVENIESIKQKNTSSVYNLIDSNKLISRMALAKASTLAPASITKITRQLIATGLVHEVEQQASTGGRPAVSLTCEYNKFQFISCKLGRKNLTIALHNIAGELLESQRTSLQSTAASISVIDILVTEIRQFMSQFEEQTHTLIAIAVTSPGLIDSQSGTIVYLPRHNLTNIPLANILNQQFNIPCYIGNHTQSLALAELYFGAAKNCQDTVLLSVHEGVGAGIINDGKVFTNFNNQVGEIGHIKVESLGQKCHCGNHGCLETVVSNGAIIKQVKNLLNEGHHSSLNQTTLSIESICAAANSGDELAIKVLERASKLLGQAIAIMINLFNPQKLLIKGEIIAAKQTVFPSIKQSVQQQALPSFLPELVITEAEFQHAPSMAGVALVQRALHDGNLLRHIIQQKLNFQV